MGTSIPGQGSLQSGSFAQKLGKKNKTMDWGGGGGGGGMELGRVNIGMKTWH